MMQTNKTTSLLKGVSRRLRQSAAILAIATAISPLATVAIPQSVYAAPAQTTPSPEQVQREIENFQRKQDETFAEQNKKCPKGQCIFTKYINPAVNALAACVGIVVTIRIIVAGIKYTMSADNPQKVSEAKNSIVISVLVLVGFFVFYAFLNWVIPGGLVGVR